MIDINLAGKLKPEKPVSTRKPPDMKRMAIIGGIGVVAIVAFLYLEEIMGMIFPVNVPTPITKTVTQPVPPPDTTEVEVEPEKPSPAWNYAKSIRQIEAYTALTRQMTNSFAYSLISVSNDRIQAEVTPSGQSEKSRLLGILNDGMKNYEFELVSVENALQIWGSYNNGASNTTTSPAEKYLGAEANIDALASFAKPLSVKIESQDLTGPLMRDGLTILPGWIKFTGTENNILAYLEKISSEKLSLNIVKLSGSEVRGLVQLFFQFELIVQ